MNINGVKVTTQEVLDTMKELESSNTYYPVHDANGKLVDLTNLPPKEILLEAVLNRRVKHEKCD